MEKKLNYKQTGLGNGSTPLTTGIPEGWEERELSSLGEIVTGKTPPTAEKDNFGYEYPFITPRDMKGQKHIEATERYLAEKGKDVVNNCVVPGGTICVSCIGSDMGKVAMATKESVTNQQLNSIVPIKINPDFVYYAVTNISEQMRDAAFHSTAVPILNKSSFSRFKISLPKDNKETDKIAKILSDLDEKIELNNQMNKTLESISQAIFKKWFVEFEFPGHEKTKVVNGLPDRWKKGCISDLLDEVISGDWGKDIVEGNFIVPAYCIRGTDIPEIVRGNKTRAPKRFIKEQNFQRSGLKEADIIIEISGGSPTQSTGRTALISKELLNRYSNMLICSNFCKALRPKKDYSIYFFCLLQQLYRNSIFFEFENGTTGIKNLDLDSFIKDYNIVIPTENVLQDFDEKILLLFKKRQTNGFESENLSQIRDSLLPMLMSGKMRVIQ